MKTSKKNRKGICMTAVRQNGLALEYCSENIQNNFEICMNAVGQNGMANLHTTATSG